MTFHCNAIQYINCVATLRTCTHACIHTLHRIALQPHMHAYMRACIARNTYMERIVYIAYVIDIAFRQ